MKDSTLNIRRLRVGWQGMFLILGAGALLFLGPWLAMVKEEERPP